MPQPNLSSSELTNLKRALGQLEEFVSSSTGTKKDIAAVIQGFEFTFEVFWKAFKKIAEREKTSAPFPRRAIAAAFQLGLIDNEELWLTMIDHRNETSHSYNEEVAKRIYDSICKRHLAAFQGALLSLEKPTGQ